MFSHCQLAIYNTFRVSTLLCDIGELPMIMSKRHTPESIGFSKLYSKKFFSVVCVLCHQGNHTLAELEISIRNWLAIH